MLSNGFFLKIFDPPVVESMGGEPMDTRDHCTSSSSHRLEMAELGLEARAPKEKKEGTLTSSLRTSEETEG